METKQLPQYEEKIAVTTVRIGNLFYNPQRVGPTTLTNLRSSSYEEGFRMGTLPELTPFFHSAVMNRKNKEYKTPAQVIQTLKDFWITGKTRPLWTPKGLWAIDNFTDEETEAELEKRLGTRQEKSVIFSNDGKTRFVPGEIIYNAPVGDLESHKVLETHPGVITIFGGEEQAGLVAEISAEHRISPYFGGFNKPVKEPTRKVAGLVSTGDVDFRLYVRGDSWSDNRGNRCSFGVRDA